MQKNTTQLTKREIVLLIIAGILLVSYLSIKYFISPTLDRYSNAVKERDELKWKKQEALLYPGSVDSNKKILSNVKDELVVKSTFFTDRVDTLKVDEEITTLLQSNGITPISVQIENGVRVDESGNDGKKSSTTTETNKDQAISVQYPAVYKYLVKVQANGLLENAKMVFDIVSHSTDRRIVKFDVIENEKTVLNFTFIVYVRDSFDLNSSEFGSNN
ncbi:MAG: hypothetical protein K0R18_917 [Bacillales bacterium]|jgi:hypothetical protein|nr:hypothetical protein [Bacillales bacterium]